MDSNLKQRIIGIIVLAALAIIIIPLFFDHAGRVMNEEKLSSHVPAPPSKPVMNVVAENPKQIQPAQIDQSVVARAQTTIKEMLSKKTQVPVVKIPAQGEAWVVQIASFSQKDNADKLVQQLQAKGYAAYIKQNKTSDNKVIMKILVGPEASLEMAQAVQKKLENELHIRGVVLKYEV